jgi:hypothetical protein
VHTNAVRQLAMDSSRHFLVVDGEDGDALLRMQGLAEDLLGRLDEPTRRMSQIVTAEALLASDSTGLTEVAVALDAVLEDGYDVSVVAPDGNALDAVLNEAAPAVEEELDDDAFASAPSVEAPVAKAPALETMAAPASGALAPEHGQVPEPAPEAEAVPIPAPTPAPRTAPRAAPVRFRLESSGVPGVIEAPGRARPEASPPAPMAPVAASAPSVDRLAPVTAGPARTAVATRPTIAPDAPTPPAGITFPGATSVPKDSTKPAKASDAAAAPAAPIEVVEVKARLQPTPPPAARGLLPDRPIEEERAWLRKALAAEFGNMSTSVARVLSEHPGFEGLRDGSSAALTDAVAVRLYLSPRGATLDAALRSGKVGPHIPLARCLVAGLSRLPSHRGPTSFAATPTAGHWELYRGNPKVTEWGFVNAVAGPCTDQPGDTDVLIWSMTGRRTRLLEAENGGVPNRVLFVPGTRFKVLELSEPGSNARGLVMMRELTARDLDDQGPADVVQRSFDELALTSMRREHEGWSGASRSGADNDGPATHFGALPGLM